MMESVFSNLILNYIQIIGDKNGKIIVSIKEKDSQHNITIEDSGE